MMLPEPAEMDQQMLNTIPTNMLVRLSLIHNPGTTMVLFKVEDGNEGLNLLLAVIVNLIVAEKGNPTLNVVIAFGSKEGGLPQYKSAYEARKRAKLEESKQISDQSDLFSLTPVQAAAPTEEEERPSRPNKVTKKTVATSYSKKRQVTKNGDVNQNLTTASGKTVATSYQKKRQVTKNGDANQHLTTASGKKLTKPKPMPKRKSGRNDGKNQTPRVETTRSNHGQARVPETHKLRVNGNACSECCVGK
jgi:hypothetical protein